MPRLDEIKASLRAERRRLLDQLAEVERMLGIESSGAPLSLMDHIRGILAESGARGVKTAEILGKLQDLGLSPQPSTVSNYLSRLKAAEEVETVPSKGRGHRWRLLE